MLRKLSFALVLKLVASADIGDFLSFLSSGHDGELPPTCKEFHPLWSSKKYKDQKICQKETIEQWQIKAQTAGPADINHCEYNQEEAKMVCDNAASCTAGEGKNYTQKVNTLQFNCTVAGALLGPSCCQKCGDLKLKASQGTLKSKGIQTDSVICEGCENIAQAKTPAKNGSDCNWVDPVKKDKVACKSGAKYEIGKGSTSEEDAKCIQINCNKCNANEAMKASCCALCLENACNRDDALRICVGCDPTVQFPVLEETQPIIETTHFLIAVIVGGLIVLTCLGRWIYTCCVNDKCCGMKLGLEETPRVKKAKSKIASLTPRFASRKRQPLSPKGQPRV